MIDIIKKTKKNKTNKKQQLQYDNVMDIGLLRRLLDNKNIIICRPDKSNAVVVLNKSDYITKMETSQNFTKFMMMF